MDETADHAADEADKRFANRVMWTIAAAVFAVSAWAVFKPAEGSRLEKAVCSDLDAGYNVNQIRGDTDPERFAQIAYGAVKDECPEHRGEVQALLEAWGLG